MSPSWIREWKRTLRRWRRERSITARRRWHPRLEILESRWAPAFDLTIGLGPTQGVSYDGDGLFTAESNGATIAVSDMVAALAAGHDVTISNGSSGTAVGSIQWLADNPLDFNNLGTARTLTIIADGSTQSGATFDVHSSVADSDPSTDDALSLVFRAWHDLTIDAPLAPRTGTLTLQADASQSGVGTLHLTGAAVVTSSAEGPEAVVLQGADLDLQSGSAIGSNLPQMFVSSTSPSFLAYDASGNLYVSSYYGQSITKFAPDGTPMPFVSSGLSYPEGLAFDADGYLYVANAGNGSILKIAPDGTASPIATNGLSYPAGLAFGPDGALYIADQGLGGKSAAFTIYRVSPTGEGGTYLPGGVVSDPQRLAFDSTGALMVADRWANRILRVFDGDSTVSIRSSVPTRPLNLGGGDAAIPGVNLTDAELARIGAGPNGSIVFGDSTQSGDVVFTTAWFWTPAQSIVVAQNAASGAAIVLDDYAGGTSNNEPAVARYYGGGLRLNAGAGGVVRAGANVTNRPDVYLGMAGTLSVSTTASFGTPAAPIVGVIGQLNASQIGGDWNWQGPSALSAAYSTVVLNGIDQTIRGANAFHNLTKTTTVADTLTLEAGALQSMTGVLTLQGAAGAPLAIRSTIPGQQALVNPYGYRSVSRVDVRDNFNINASPLVAVRSTDSGNTTNWEVTGDPTRLKTLSGSSLSSVVARSYGSLPVVVTDANGRPVGGVDVTFAIVAGPGGAAGTFGGATTVRTNVNGIAFSPVLTAGTTAGEFRVTASVDGSLPPFEFQLNNLPGAAALVVVAGGSPQSATVGTYYGTRLQVLVTDTYGNPTANVAVTFTAPTRGASGRFVARSTVVTDALGIATAPAFRANLTRGRFYVTATVAGLPVAQFELTNVTIVRRRR